MFYKSMNFKDKYAPMSEKDKPQNKDKVILSDEDYLLIDALYIVANYLRRIKKW